ncbi:MAG: hypothetical protein JRI68_33820, partial [Deltaproteobacteria bacterium]|nr:hypothetical protein [Deltaproteobacteria bacterium]
MKSDSESPKGHKPGTVFKESSRLALHRAASLSEGDVVGGHYVVDDLLAEGGMAIVYRARNAATGKPCALKV